MLKRSFRRGADEQAFPAISGDCPHYHDIGADTVTHRNTGGTDHLAFDAVGLPGFQFIQDRLDYSTRTHHTNVDVLDHAERDDLIQASVVIASFVYHAAMRDEKLPREPMPRKPDDD